MRRIGGAALMLVATIVVVAALRIATDGLVVQAEAGTVSSRRPLAILDVTFVYMNSVEFRSQMNRMRERVEAHDRKIAANRKRINALSDRLSAGVTPSEYEAISKEIRAYMDAIQSHCRPDPNSQDDFRGLEARIYLQTYRAILAEVDSYCKENHVELVIRSFDEPAATTGTDRLLRRIPGRNIVWTGRQVRDISQEILARVNKRTGKDELPQTKDRDTHGSRPEKTSVIWNPQPLAPNP